MVQYYLVERWLTYSGYDGIFFLSFFLSFFQAIVNSDM
jgi:hypothetical protein